MVLQLAYRRERGAAEIDFSVLENDLRFIYIGENNSNHHIVVQLKYGLGLNNAVENKKSIIHLVVTNDEYNNSINYLKERVRLFPVRGKLGKRSRESLPGPVINTVYPSEAFEDTDSFFVEIYHAANDEEGVKKYEIQKGSEEYDKLKKWAWSSEFSDNWHLSHAVHTLGKVYKGGGYEFNFTEKQVVIKGPTGQYVKRIKRSDYVYLS